MYGEKTPYHKRKARALQRARESRGDASINKYISVDRFLATFESIYNEYYGTKLTIRYSRGWYYLGSSHLHKSDLVRLMERMLAELHSESYPPPEEDNNV